MKLKYLNTVLRYYRFLSTYLLTTGEGQPPFDIMVVPLVIHNICLGENGTQIHGTNIPSLFLVSFAAANLPQPGNHSEAIRDVNPIDSAPPSRLPDYICSLYLLSLHSFRLLRPHSATIMRQWRMQVLNRPVYSILQANWPSPINNGGPSALWLINGRASAPFH